MNEEIVTILNYIMSNSITVNRPPLHVSTIVNQLNYATLAHYQIVPDLLNQTAKKVFTIGQCPPTIHRGKRYDRFGLFVDYLIRKMIQSLNKQITYDDSCEELMQSANWHTTIATITNIVNKHPTYSSKLKIAEMQQIFLHNNNTATAYFQAIYNFIKQAFDPINCTIELEPEFVYENIQGHPDIFYSTVILDTKTVRSYRKTAPSALLQVSAYTCLARAMGKTITHVGILLPLQKHVPCYDISSWDHRPFYQLMQYIANGEMYYLQPQQVIHYDDAESRKALSCVGSHISARGDLAGRLQSCKRRGMVVQIMLAGNIRGPGKRYTDEFIATLAAIDVTLFVHGPYTVNLAKTINNDGWPLTTCIDTIRSARAIGAYGCVFHVGKHCIANISASKYAERMQIMEDNIRAVLTDIPADSTCPFLLETPAGQGTEMLTKIEEYIAFYNRFSKAEKAKFKLCIDTCHVYSVGYSPEQYLQYVITHCGAEAVALVHFNDSKVPAGACNDSHHYFGRGYIGYPIMATVAKICVQHNIPMVTE